MQGDIDYDLKLRTPTLYLAKPDRTIIAILSEAYNIQYSLVLGGISTLEFDLPYEKDVNHQLVRSNADSVKYRYLIKIQIGSDSEWLLIDKPPQDSMSESSDSMHVTAKSLAIELKDKNLYTYSESSYTATQVITDLLSDTIWTIGTIDSLLDEKYRLYEFSNTNVFDALIQVADKVDGILQFDTENRTVSLDKEADIGVDRGLRINYGKYLKSMNRSYDSQDIVTRLIPIGQDGLTINAVTPHAQDWVQDFSNFTTSTYMSTGLISAVQAYDALLATKEPTEDTLEAGSDTTTLVITTHSLSTGDWILNTDRSDAYRKVTVVDPDTLSVATAVTGQTVGDTVYKYATGTFRKLLFNKEELQSELTVLENDLVTLQDELVTLKDTLAIVLESASEYTAGTASTSTNLQIDGHNASTGWWAQNETRSNAYREITAIPDINNLTLSSAVTGQTMGDTVYLYSGNPTGSDRDTKIASITSKEGDITSKEAEITAVDLDITNMNTAVSMASNFTTSQLTELNPFIIEKTWENIFYTEEQDLYEAAKVELEKRNAPQPILDIDIVNFLLCIQNQHEWDKLGIPNLGDTVYIEYDRINIDIEAKIIQIDFDFENADVNLTIANIKAIKEKKDKALDWFHKSINTTNEFNIKKVNYNTTYTNFTNRNDRLTTTPADPVVAADGTAVDRILNSDGSVDIYFNWTFSGATDAYNIDGFHVYVRSAITNEQYVFGSSVAREEVFNISPLKRSFILYGVPATYYYTFGIQAYRVVDDDIDSDGIMKSNIVQPSLANEDPYKPATDLNHNTINKSPINFIIADADTTSNTKKADYIVPAGATANATIIAAIAALPAGGGHIHFLDGTYNMDLDDTQNISDSNLIISGQGRATIFKIDDGYVYDGSSFKIFNFVNSSNLNLYSFNVNGNASVVGFSPYGIYFDNVTKSTIEDVLVTDYSSGHGLYINGSDSITLKNNIAYGNFANGILVNNSNSCKIYYNNCYNITNAISNGNGIVVIGNNNILIGNDCNNNAGVGIYCQSSGTDDNLVANNNCNNNSAQGIYFTGGDGNTLNSNVCLENGGNGIFITSVTNSNINGNICKKNSHHGICLDTASNNSVVGNECVSNSQATNNTYSGITLQNNCDDNHIQGNTSRQGSGANKQKYGIDIASVDCDTNKVTDNDLITSGVTGSLNDSGTGTVTASANRT